MARHQPELHRHEETICELFAFVSDATQLTNGELEKFFGFCPEDRTTTGKDWWRWSHPDPSKRVMPYRAKIAHVLRVVRTGKSQWGGADVPKRKGQDMDALEFTEELCFKLSQGLIFTSDPEHNEPIFQGRDEDLLLHLRQVGLSYLGLAARLADLTFTLDPELPKFAAEQYQRLTIQRKTLEQALTQLNEMPTGLVLGEIDQIDQIRRHIQSAIQSIDNVLPFLDYAGGHYPAWVCADVITSYKESQSRDSSGNS